MEDTYTYIIFNTLLLKVRNLFYIKTSQVRNTFYIVIPHPHIQLNKVSVLITFWAMHSHSASYLILVCCVWCKAGHDPLNFFDNILINYILWSGKTEVTTSWDFTVLLNGVRMAWLFGLQGTFFVLLGGLVQH